MKKMYYIQRYILFSSASSSGYLISLCQFCLQLILILGTSGFEVPFMPMPGGHCESDDLKVLGVDLDLDLMQNGTADAFFEAIGTPPPSPDSSSQAIIKSEFEANTLPAEAKVVRLGNY